MMNVSELKARLNEIPDSYEVFGVLPKSMTLYEIEYLQTWDGGEQLHINIGRNTFESI